MGGPFSVDPWAGVSGPVVPVHQIMQIFYDFVNPYFNETFFNRSNMAQTCIYTGFALISCSFRALCILTKNCNYSTISVSGAHSGSSPAYLFCSWSMLCCGLTSIFTVVLLLAYPKLLFNTRAAAIVLILPF